VLQNATDILGEEAAVTVETLRFNVLKAGSNVFYANSVAGRSFGRCSSCACRSPACRDGAQSSEREEDHVGGCFDGGLQHEVSGSRLHGRLPPGPRDRPSLRLSAFKPVADYGPHTSPMEGEIGSIEQVRFLTSTVIAPFFGTGVATASAPTMRHSDAGTGDKVDVYPILIFARDAFGIVPLKGKTSMTPMVVNPKPASGDPLAQRGTVGWKLWTATVILQDLFMARLEVACTA
jgi:hypothetical protein